MKNQVFCISDALKDIKNSQTYELYIQKRKELENNERYLELIELLETELSIEDKKKYRLEYLELKASVIELQIQLNELIDYITKSYEKELDANNNGKISCVC